MGARTRFRMALEAECRFSCVLYSLKAAVKPDPLLLVTITVFITAVVGAVALLRDLLEIAIDPRVRKSQGGG